MYRIWTLPTILGVEILLIVKSILITLRKLPSCINLVFCCMKLALLLFGLYLLLSVYIKTGC